MQPKPRHEMTMFAITTYDKMFERLETKEVWAIDFEEALKYGRTWIGFENMDYEGRYELRSISLADKTAK